MSKTVEELGKLSQQFIEDYFGPEGGSFDEQVVAETSFLAGYKAAAPQWVSTKDMLPKIGEYVLVTHRTSQDSDSLVVMEAKRLNESEYTIDGGDGILVEYVDYWMPLPSPPRKDNP